MIKIILLILNSINLFSSGFKTERTLKISPLSNTIIEIEKMKNQQSQQINLMKTETAFKTFNKENSKNRQWKMKKNSYGIPSLLSGDKTKRYYGGNIQETSKKFISENRELLGIDLNNLKFKNESVFLNTMHIEYQQEYKGIPVEFSYVKVHSNSDGEISLYNSRYFPYINININPNITIDYAKSIIISQLGNISVSTYSLVIYPDELNDEYYLAWKIKTDGGSGYLNGKWLYYIDAKTGKILLRFDERQYACNLQEETTGYVYGEVYDISPVPTGVDNGPGTWAIKITTPIPNQYVFAGGVSVSTITKLNGEYCIDYDPGNNGAKVFMTTMGPYFSVMNFNGKPNLFTNGTRIWRTVSTPMSVNSYPNNSEITYPFSPSYSLGASEAFAFVGPVFSTLNIGKIDNCGNGIDNDMLYVIDSTGNTLASWFGVNKSNLFAGLVPSTSYKLKIKSDPKNSGSFNINISSYLVIGGIQNANNSTGSVIWSTSNYLSDENGASINTFYHLNKVRDFIMKFNSKCQGNGCINLNKRVPVMTGVYGDEYCGGASNTMTNAFYDMEHDAIFLGKGTYQNGYYKDFGLDGTVIRHEYGHLVINRIYPIIYFGEFGAITEAISDYLAISSFWDEGKTITILGNFIAKGEDPKSPKRDLSTITKKMPNDWVGQVHSDGEILSGALYKIRKSTTSDNEEGFWCNINTGDRCLYNLGKFSSGPLSGFHKADIYLFGTMFYFPDSFENFLEAMVDLCKQIEGTGCAESKIRNAFGFHGIGAQAVVDIYEPNNGPEHATNISTITTITAYIDYPGDEDYYVIPLKEGAFHARLYLPESQSYPNYYHSYSLFLFDSKRNYVKDISPDYIPDLCYSETVPSNCFTKSSYVDLYYNVEQAQIYYLAVTGSLNDEYGNGIDHNRNVPYILNYNAQTRSVVNAELKNRKIDEDEIEFTAIVPKFDYINSFPPTNWSDGSEFEFCEYNCIKILDNNLKELSTNYITVGYASGETKYNTTDSAGRSVIKGKLIFKTYDGKTFSQRYPGAGTIYIKIYAKNHMFGVGKTGNYIPLGLSNPINLTASKNDFISYNNILDKNNSNMTLKYEATSNSNIKIVVYTATGHKVKTIYDGPAIGKITFNWDGTDDNGSKLASGVYYIKTEGAINKVEKVAIVR